MLLRRLPRSPTMARLGWVGSCLLASSTAQAASFDPSGELSFEPDAVYTQSFEEPLPEPDAGALDGGDPDAGPTLVIEPDPTALHGGHLLRLQPFEGASLDLPLPSTSKTFGARLWARGEVVATLELEVAGRVEDFGVFYPTGRMTSDGWYELALHDLAWDVSRVQKATLGFFAPGGGDVDAAELVPEGELVAAADCFGANDQASCSSSQICMWGRCRNFASRVPALPPPAWRDDLVDYLDQRFALLYGPFENRLLDLPSARLEIEAMRSAPDAWSFWRHFRVAIHRLHDWHTRGSDVAGYVLSNPRPIAVCFIEGSADLSQGAAPSTSGLLDVLVSHVGEINTFGLGPGDRLVAVDGNHPIEWARSLVDVDFGYETASNHQTHAEPVARLGSLIAAFAHQIEVARCDATTGTCSTQTELIDISALPPSPLGTKTGIGCDNRPLAHLPGVPDTHPQGGFFSGIVIESDEVEAIYGLQWSSLAVGMGGNLGPLLEQAVADWRLKARGVILDHRTGHGGTSLGPAIIWNFVREPIALDAFHFRQRADEQAPASLAAGKLVFQQLEAQNAVEIAGGTDPALDIPVALLIHLDGSASDWLPLGMKGAPKAKIFGPYQTAGAFSTLFTFGYWFGLGYSIAVGDTLHSSGQMLNGTGVEPDVVVVPRQSDLLAGKDTVYDAAIAWVRQELAP